MQGGSAPVCVHDIAYATMCSPAGTRPRPVKPGESAMRSVPVRVVVRCGDHRLELNPQRWLLLPHTEANADPERRTADGSALVPVGPEQLPALVFYCLLPKGYRIVSDEPAEAELPIPVEAEEPHTIPELEAVDPAVFAFNHDAFAVNIRELHKRPMGSEINPAKD